MLPSSTCSTSRLTAGTRPMCATSHLVRRSSPSACLDGGKASSCRNATPNASRHGAVCYARACACRTARREAARACCSTRNCGRSKLAARQSRGIPARRMWARRPFAACPTDWRTSRSFRSVSPASGCRRRRRLPGYWPSGKRSQPKMSLNRKSRPRYRSAIIFHIAIVLPLYSGLP